MRRAAHGAEAVSAHAGNVRSRKGFSVRPRGAQVCCASMACRDCCAALRERKGAPRAGFGSPTPPRGVAVPPKKVAAQLEQPLPFRLNPCWPASIGFYERACFAVNSKNQPTKERRAMKIKMIPLTPLSLPQPMCGKPAHKRHRGTCRQHRGARAFAKSASAASRQRQIRSRRRRQTPRRAQIAGEEEGAGEGRADRLQRARPTRTPPKSALPKTRCGRRCIPPTSSRRSRR